MEDDFFEYGNNLQLKFEIVDMILQFLLKRAELCDLFGFGKYVLQVIADLSRVVGVGTRDRGLRLCLHRLRVGVDFWAVFVCLLRLLE